MTPFPKSLQTLPEPPRPGTLLFSGRGHPRIPKIRNPSGRHAPARKYRICPGCLFALQNPTATAFAAVGGFLKQEFDFSKDGKWKINRRDEPYPKDLEDAKEIWRLKIKFDLLTLKLGGTELEEAENRLMKRVRGLWKDYSQYDDDDVIALFLNAMANAFDPHSAYMAAQELKNFDISIKLSLDGIGAVLRWEDGYTVVNSIIPEVRQHATGNSVSKTVSLPWHKATMLLKASSICGSTMWFN